MVSVAEELIPLIDRGMRKEGVVRSQFVRRAVREKLERLPNLEPRRSVPRFINIGGGAADASNIATAKPRIKGGKVTVMI